MLKRVILPYMLFVFLSNFSTILYFLTVYLEHEGFSLTTISAMLLAYQIGKFVSEVPTGYIADRYGRKASGLLGVAGLIAYYLALLFVQSPTVLLIAFVVKGISLACISGSIEAIYIDSVPQEALVSLNVIERFVFYASYAISAFLGGMISAAQAYRVGLSCDIVAMVLTLAVVALIHEPRDGAKTMALDGHVTVGQITQAILYNPCLIEAYVMDVSQAFAFVSLEDFFTLMLNERGMNSVAAGATVAVQLLCSAGLGLAIPSLLKRIDQRRFARLTGCTRYLLTALFLLPFMPRSLLPLLYILQTVAYVFFAPIKYSIFQSNAPAQFRCSLISVQSLMVSVGAILFYAFNALFVSSIGVSSSILVALLLSALLYIPALFKLTKDRGGSRSKNASLRA